MAKTKHSFVDDNPYLVGTDAANVNVYADKPNVSIDNVFGFTGDVYIFSAVPDVGDDLSDVQIAAGINGIINGGKAVFMVSEGQPAIACGATGYIILGEDVIAENFTSVCIFALDGNDKFTAVNVVDANLRAGSVVLGADVEYPFDAVLFDMPFIDVSTEAAAIVYTTLG